VSVCVWEKGERRSMCVCVFKKRREREREREKERESGGAAVVRRWLTWNSSIASSLSFGFTSCGVHLCACVCGSERERERERGAAMSKVK